MGWAGSWAGAWAGSWGGSDAAAPPDPEGAVTLPAGYTVALVGADPPARAHGEPALLHLHRTQGDTIAIAFELGGLDAQSVEGATFTFVHELLGTRTAIGDGSDRVAFEIDESDAVIDVGIYPWHLVINDGVVGSELTIAHGRDYLAARNLDA